MCTCLRVPYTYVSVRFPVSFDIVNGRSTQIYILISVFFLLNITYSQRLFSSKKNTMGAIIRRLVVKSPWQLPVRNNHHNFRLKTIITTSWNQGPSQLSVTNSHHNFRLATTITTSSSRQRCERILRNSTCRSGVETELLSG